MEASEMENQRFDDLTRSLRRAAASRRRLLMSAAVGGLVTALAVSRAEAAPVACRPVGAHCKRGGQCCSARCKNHKCRAHDVGTCTAAQNFCTTGTHACGGG